VVEAMGIPLGVLRWLTFHRRGAALVHYHCWGVLKKTGGVIQAVADRITPLLDEVKPQ